MLIDGLHVVAGQSPRGAWESVASIPEVKAVAVSYLWRDLWPRYNFPLELDALIADQNFLHDRGKLFSLRVLTGPYVTGWVYNRPGVRKMSFYDEGGVYGMPVVFDTGFRQVLGEFWTRLADAGVQPDIIHLTGPTCFTAETRLPNTDADIETWQRKGYSEDGIVSAWAEVLVSVGVEFPNAIQVLDLAPVLKVDNALMRIAGLGFDYLQNNILTPSGAGQREDWAILDAHSYKGFQRKPGQFDASLTPAQLLVARRDWFRGWTDAGIALGARYLEAGPSEVVDFADIVGSVGDRLAW